MAQFIQLDTKDCDYLLTLISDMDSDTVFTAQQRVITTEKLMRIRQDPYSTKLQYKDVTYLLELIEDDDLESCSAQRGMTLSVLEDIQALQTTRFKESLSIEDQREARRLRRLGIK